MLSINFPMWDVTLNDTELQLKDLHNHTNLYFDESTLWSYFVLNSPCSNGFNIIEWLDKQWENLYNSGSTSGTVDKIYDILDMDLDVNGNVTPSILKIECSFNMSSGRIICNFMIYRKSDNYYLGMCGSTIDHTYGTYSLFDSFNYINLVTLYSRDRQKMVFGLTRSLNDIVVSTGPSSYDYISRNVPLEQCPFENENNYVAFGYSSLSAASLQNLSVLTASPNFSENASYNPQRNNNSSTDESTSGGGGGKYTDNSDYTTDSTLPTVSALSSGFIELYNPTKAQIKSLSDFMLTDNFLNNVKKLFTDPMDYIITLNLLPVSPNLGGSKNITVGGVDTGVASQYVSSQYVKFSCGSVKLPEKWGGFEDYAPLTSVKIYLPFIGYRDLDTDDCMNSTITVTYNIDVLSGACIAEIQCKTNKKLNGVVYTFEGNCAMGIPISATDFTSRYTGLLSTLGASIGTVASISTGNVAGAITGIASTINSIAGSKPNVQRSGALSGNMGILGGFTPVLIITRPTQSLAKNYISQRGYPSNIGGKISSFHGYTEFSSIKLSGIPCTDEEMKEIESMLKGGVYLE